MESAETETVPTTSASGGEAGTDRVQQSGPGSRGLENEIQNLTQTFKGQLKVLQGTGRFSTIVKLHPEGLDIVFNFKLTENYPVDAPVIVVRSESMAEDEIFDLTGFLALTAEKMAADPMLLRQLVDTGLGWLKEGHIDISGRGIKKALPSKKGKKGKAKEKKRTKDVAEKPKKPPMKTAIDVVKRIQWDSALPRDEFLVGYMDRIDGLKEKYFTAFSWEDIASVDYTVLAIPKHRIQYFKYRDEIVWDKRCRLDNIFGSTGSKTTITDVIKRQNSGAQNQLNDVQPDVPDDDEHHEDSDYYDSGSYSDSDSDSDDGINVTLGDAAIGYVDSDNDVSDEEQDGAFNKYWRDKLRPNYFLALRMDNEEIQSMVERVQDHIVENEPRLSQCCIPKGALHITLCTLGLDTKEQVENAVQCLQEAKEELASFVPKEKTMKVEGVANFFNRVVYGKVQYPQEFIDLVEHLKLCLNERGIDIRDYHEFVPHMTLMKISRPVAKATGKKYVSPWLYSCFNSTVFGNQAVDNIHLCEMGDDRQSDGFYITATSLKI